MNYSEKQIQIIETAERLFSEHGFTGTSVRDIAQEANINLAMVSYYFGSKDKLLEAIFEHRSEKIRTTLEHLLNDKMMEPSEKIEKVIDAFVNRIMSMQNFHRIMMR